MTRWIVAAALVAASVGGTAADAAPKAKKPKPWHRTYDVSLPQPWVVGSMGTATDCSSAPAGPSKHVTTVTLTHAGKLDAQLKGHVGEWFLEIYDAKGKLLTSASSIGTGHVVGLRHKGGKQSYQVAVCNYAGGPNGTVTLTYKPA